MPVFNMFVSGANVHLQREMRSSPWPTVFISSACSVVSSACSVVSSAYSVRLQHKTRWLLAISTFVCSVISYLEVSSRNLLVASVQHVCLPSNIVFAEVNSREYLIANDKCICVQCDIIKMKRVVFESWFRNHPPKRTETRGKRF